MAQAFHIEAAEVHKAYRLGARTLEILRGVNLQVERGEHLAIIGASGAGKSTLLNVLGGLDTPTAGAVHVDGRDLYRLPQSARAAMRARGAGFVFQSYHLLPELTLVDNVMLPALTAPGGFLKIDAHRARARELIGRVGLAERLAHRPDELSGGEQQRAALARALMNDPDLLFADEPTGNLDSVTGERVLHHLFDLAGDRPRTVILVTHNPEVAARCDRVLVLRDGRIEER